MGRTGGGSNKTMHWKISVIAPNSKNTVFSKQFTSIREAADFFKIPSIYTLIDMHRGKSNICDSRKNKYANFLIEKIDKCKKGIY